MEGTPDPSVVKTLLFAVVKPAIVFVADEYNN